MAATEAGGAERAGRHAVALCEKAVFTVDPVFFYPPRPVLAGVTRGTAGQKNRK